MKKYSHGDAKRCLFKAGAWSAIRNPPRAALHYLLRNSISREVANGSVSRHDHKRIASRSSNSDVEISTVPRKESKTGRENGTKRHGRAQKSGKAAQLHSWLHEFPCLEA
jgi:hypothetical protein